MNQTAASSNCQRDIADMSTGRNLKRATGYSFTSLDARDMSTGRNNKMAAQAMLVSLDARDMSTGRNAGTV